MEIINADGDRVGLPRTSSIFVSKLFRLYDCRYFSSKNMIYQTHTASNFLFVMLFFSTNVPGQSSLLLSLIKSNFLFSLLQNSTVQVFHRHTNSNYCSVLNVVSRIACFALLARISILLSQYNSKAPNLPIPVCFSRKQTSIYVQAESKCWMGR